MSEECIFCDIVHGRAPASVVYGDELTMAFVDLRQFNAGHVLVIPRAHLHDVRELDESTGAALMATVATKKMVVASRGRGARKRKAPTKDATALPP